MLNVTLSLMGNDDGQGLVEYALIIALVSVVAIHALLFLGNGAKSQLNSAASAINAG